jgi:acyl-CoA reductase-like NAD-dependent aldehyde dehydrogenase
MNRVSVAKTYKLYIGGAFPRSESGYTFEVTDPSGKFAANAAQASRKDARDAVVAARKAHPGWASATAYNRGQVLYRIAEMLEGRSEQLAEEIRIQEGVTIVAARKQVQESIDTWVWYAGWADKYSQVVGHQNPVAGPYFGLSVPEPNGVVAAWADSSDKGYSLLGLVHSVAPIIVSGNTVVVGSHPTQPLPAMTFAEVLHSSDVPGGVVNILTGVREGYSSWLAHHKDVNALDLLGASELDWADLEAAGGETLKRLVTPARPVQPVGLERIRAFVDIKTIWHTKALG